MIKTTTTVAVPTKNNRDVEHKQVYAEILETAVRQNDYLPLVQEYVFDEVTFVDANKKEQIGIKYIKRILYHNTNSPLSIQEIETLISMLQDDTTLTSLGLEALHGVYDSIPTLSEKMRFVMKFGLLLDYNQKQRRGVSWINE